MLFNRLIEYYSHSPGRQGPIESWRNTRSKLLQKISIEQSKIQGIDIEAMERMYNSIYYGSNQKNYIGKVAQAAMDTLDNKYSAIFNEGMDLIADRPLTTNFRVQKIDNLIEKYTNSSSKAQVKTLQKMVNEILTYFKKLPDTKDIAILKNKKNILEHEIIDFVNKINTGTNPNSYLQLNQNNLNDDLLKILNHAKVLASYFDNSTFNNPQLGKFFELSFEAVSNSLETLIENEEDIAVKTLAKNIVSSTNTATKQVKMSNSMFNSEVIISEETLNQYTNIDKKGKRKAKIDVGYAVDNNKKVLEFKINQNYYNFNSTGQQKADIVLQIKDKNDNLQDIGISLKNWNNMYDGKTKFESLVLHSIFQSTGGMGFVKNFTYMLQDREIAGPDHFTSTAGTEAINTAFDIAKVCGASTALMGIGQQSSSRAQLLTINDRSRKQIKILNIPNILLKFFSGYEPLIWDNPKELENLHNKLIHLGYYLNRQQDGSEHFYGLSTALLSSVKLKFSLK